MNCASLLMNERPRKLSHPVLTILVKATTPWLMESHPVDPQLIPDEGVSNTYCRIVLFYVCYRWWGVLLLKGYMHIQNMHVNIFISFIPYSKM